MATGPEGGSSLIEVLLGAVLVVSFVGALLVIAMQQGNQRQVNVETSLAVTAAIDNLERIRNVDASLLPTLDGSDFDVAGINGATGGLRALRDDSDGLPGELSVAADQTFAGTTLYRVIATVAWQGAGQARRLQLETLITGRK